jgi:ABC-2 type transport system ATP-binding protein
VIVTKQLKRTYGNLNALKGIDLVVNEGDLFGFIGPNGAGKTTTIRILTTLLEPSSGEATVGGFSVWTQKQEIRGIIGYMPDSFGVYRDMTVTEYLHFFAAAYGIPYRDRKALVTNLLDLTDLGTKTDALIDTLSRGMQQRLGLARTLVHDPKVLVLDEPASGLDPRARIEIREILKELRKMGKTILLSSHILSDLSEICNRVGILERGELVAQGTLDEVMSKAREDADVIVHTTDDERAVTVLKELAPVKSADPTEDKKLVVIQLKHAMDLADLSAHLSGRGIHIRHLERREPTLEQVFMKLTQGLVQ